MSFEGDQVTYLEANAGIITALGDRIYPLRLPQGLAVSSQAALVWQKIIATPDHTHGTGALDIPNGLVEARVNYRVWSTKYTVTLAAATALRNALDGFSHGLMGTTDVDSVLCLRETDIGDPDRDEYGISADYQFFYHQ